MEETRSTAPVQAHAEVDIAADPREVWAVIADIAAWPTWDPAVREAFFEADLEVGARFRYVTPLGSLRCRLSDVDAPRILAWQGRLLAVRLQQAYRLETSPEGSHVTVDASLSGIGARLFRDRLTERLQRQLEALVQLLKLEAETRAAEQLEMRGPSGAQEEVNGG